MQVSRSRDDEVTLLDVAASDVQARSFRCLPVGMRMWCVEMDLGAKSLHESPARSNRQRSGRGRSWLSDYLEDSTEAFAAMRRVSLFCKRYSSSRRFLAMAIEDAGQEMTAR